ncbi:MAG: ABC transporter permease [Candidatus Eisenbacteria bacterium]
MRAIAPLIAKDLRRRRHAPLNLLLTLAFPLALLAIIGLAFRPGDSSRLPSIRLLVENRDGALLGNFVSGALRNERMAEFFEVVAVDPGTGEEIVADGDASALLVLPEGMTDSLLAGGRATLTLVKDPGGVVLPGIAESFGELLALVLSTGTKILGEPLREVRSLWDGDGWPADETVAGLAVTFQNGFRRAEGIFLPPAIGVKKVKVVEAGVEGDDEIGGFNIFAYLFPGIVVLGLLFVAQISMRDLVREREEGHLARILSSPVSMSDLIASKLISTILLLGICHGLLAAIAGPLFGIRWGNVPASILLVAAEGLAVTGLLALLFSIVRTERQGHALSSVVILAMSLMGGSMVPTEFFPSGFRAVTRMTVNYWAIEGFREVLIGGGGVPEILPHLAVLTLFGVVTAGGAAFLLPHRIRRAGA